MKKKCWLIAIFSMAFIIFLATCNKKQASDPIEKVTYSKNFKSSLTDANIWFDFNFVFHNPPTNGEIAAKKEYIESYYVNLLARVQITQHEIYFKWVNLSTEPLEYRLIGYITPPQVKGANDRSLGAGDPPIPPPPPPPSG